MASVWKLEQNQPGEKELLVRTLHKAKQGGFKFRNLIDDYDYFSITSFNPETGRLVIVLRNEDRHQIVYDSIYLLFFDTKFARALFGADWEQHLLALARSTDKLNYIREHVQTD